MPIERAVPRTVRMAASMSVQFMSCIFIVGELTDLLLGDLADLDLVRLLRAGARLLAGGEAADFLRSTLTAASSG